MVVADAVLRKLPGALGHADGASRSPSATALGGEPEYPHYTRPAELPRLEVPEVLLSATTSEIREWRRARSRERGAGAERLSDARRGSAILIGRAARRSAASSGRGLCHGPVAARLPSP